MSDLTTEQDAAVEYVVARCHRWGGFQRKQVWFNNHAATDADEMANAIVLDGNRNSIHWWIGTGASVEIRGIAEFDFEGNRVK